MVEIRGEAPVRGRSEVIAHVLGYRLVSTEQTRRPTIGLGPFPAYRGAVSVRLLFQRDDDSRARRRAGEAVERLRAGGLLAPEMETPPPPPPGPPRWSAPRPRRSLEPQPPLPVGERPRVPPRPAYPPPPVPPPPPED